MLKKFFGRPNFFLKFFVDDDIRGAFHVDNVVALVDAKHAEHELFTADLELQVS